MQGQKEGLEFKTQNLTHQTSQTNFDGSLSLGSPWVFFFFFFLILLHLLLSLVKSQITTSIYQAGTVSKNSS